MLRQYELVEQVKAYDPDADEDLLNRAYVFSMMAHGNQMRASGDPYFSHPIEVAGILTDLKLDTETIVTGILHDTIEDTVASHEDIERLFGERIAALVDGVTKLSRIEIQTESERAAENFRKFLLAMSADIRVLLVKLADRLHNMRTLHFIKNQDKRQRIARETMDIYAPLAERIGMNAIKDELIDIAFRELSADAYTSMTAEIQALRQRNGDVVVKVVADINKLLNKAGLNADVSGREKRPYSIWKKMQDRGLVFEQLSDVMAFRIIVEKEEQLYPALGFLHGHWPCVPGRFKDYVSTPKRNGYQSLHTAVMTANNARIEVQIRTEAMHRQAEFGVAAHWTYKQGVSHVDQEAFPWLQNLLEILEHQHDADEFLEHTRLEMYQDQVFCFTPKGALIPLPKGSTPLDFAYAVHTRVGNSCVGCKVNGRAVPLRTILKNGDQVEVLRSKTQVPQASWESFVVTGKARSAIRRFLRVRQQEEYTKLGGRLLRQLVARLDVPVSDAAIEQALVRLKLPDLDSLHAALVRHDIEDIIVMDAILPGVDTKKRKTTKGKPAAHALTVPLTLKGLTPGVLIKLAECCRPVPGDRIVAVKVVGQGFDVHVIDCPTLEQYDHLPEPWVDVAWLSDENSTAVYKARIIVVVSNEPGSLASVATILARHEANIANFKLSQRDSQFHTNILDIEVNDLAHLTNILAALRAALVVSSAERDRRDKGSDNG